VPVSGVRTGLPNILVHYYSKALACSVLIPLLSRLPIGILRFIRFVDSIRIAWPIIFGIFCFCPLLERATGMGLFRATTAEPSGLGDGNEDSFVGNGREAKRTRQQSEIGWRKSAPSKALKYKRANCTSSSASHEGAANPPEATRVSTASVTWRYSQLNHFRPSPSTQVAWIVRKVSNTSPKDCGGVLTAPQRTESYGNVCFYCTISAVGSKPVGDVVK
jgi:hypothetical protein